MTPFGRGSVSLRLYPHNDLPAPAPAIVDELRAQAALAAGHAAKGHDQRAHGGFAGYLPNLLQQVWTVGGVHRRGPAGDRGRTHRQRRGRAHPPIPPEAILG